MVLRWSIILEQNDTMLKQCWLFMVNSRPHFMLQDCAVILAIDCGTIGMGWSSPSVFWLKNMACMTIRASDCAMQFSCLVTLGNSVQHSVISAYGQMNVSMICLQLKCYHGMIQCLCFFSAAGGWWQEERA